MSCQLNIRKLLVFALPNMLDANKHSLQNVYEKSKPPGNVIIGPHFTLLTITDNFSKNELSELLRSNLQGQNEISFCLRTALFMPPINQYESWYAFLIPDEGFSELCKLHRQIHKGKLRSALDLNFPFIPHITVGSFADKDSCVQLVNEINALPVEIFGSIETLTLVEVVNNQSHVFDEIKLG